MAKAAIKTWSTPVQAEEKRLIPCAICGGTVFKPSLSCEGFSYVRCAKCSLVQMNPQPLPGEIVKRYNSGKGVPGNMDLPGYSAGSGKDYLAYELANEEAFLNLQLLALKDSGFESFEKKILERSQSPQSYEKPKILDIGCATGSLLQKLKGRGWETVGVEISHPQAEYGRSMRELDVHELPLEENNFPLQSFDAVLASHVIEHLVDPAGMVREVFRILYPGGIFFVTTPNIAGFQARFFGKNWRSAIFDHLYLFSVETLSRLLREEGFVIEKIKTWGGLAAGTAPRQVKGVFDRAAKKFGFGDVMIIRAKKPMKE